ncbi:hypothetical protein Aperf_G00000121820 [Anoplocephala perfoliata]
MEGLKHFPEKSILRKNLCSKHEHTSSPISMRKPVFEGQIKTTFILDDSDPSLSPTEVTEVLHEDESDKKTSTDSQSRRKSWLRQTISVDGERVPGKLLHQCSLDHGYIIRNSSTEEETVHQQNPYDNAGDENDLEDLQSQRALVEAELRRQSKAPPGIKIRDLLASKPLIEDEDDDENENEGAESEEELKGSAGAAFDQHREGNARNSAQAKQT